MVGWWIMPIFGVLCLFIVLFFVSRFFGAGGGFCGRPPADRDGGMEELRKEIRALRDEVKDLKGPAAGEAMNRAMATAAFTILFAVTAYADDSVKEFSFKTVDGKIVEYKVDAGSALVVSIGSHW